MQSIFDIFITDSFFAAFSYSVTMFIALLSLYESFSNRKKYNQINKETLVSKVSIDFDYKTEKSDDKKIVKGKIIFTNKGTTNIKLVELDFDVKDRSDELREAFVPNSSDEKYSTHSEGVHSLDLLGFNNSKLLSFKNPQDKYFQIYRTDSAYVFPENSKIRNFDMDDNLTSYINKKVNTVFDLFKNFKMNKEKIKQILIGDLLIKEIRGLQLFPGEVVTQEFVASYKGSGTVILNVEAASLRFLQQSVTKGDEFKALVDDCVDDEAMSEQLKNKMISVLLHSLRPSSNEIMDHRKTYLLYLP